MTKRIDTTNINRNDWDTKVLRYLNFSGLVALLETSSLHFSSVFMFQDAHDGYSIASVTRISTLSLTVK